MAGPIALVGSGEFLPAMEEIDAALLAGRPPKAVIVPTAAALDGAERVRYWLDLGRAHYEGLGVEAVELPVLSRDDADDEELAAAVLGAGLVYLSGGSPGHLVRTLAGSRVWAAIEQAWRAGAALAGCSAGAMALGQVSAEGLSTSLLPGLRAAGRLAVLPHFDRLERFRPGLAAEFVARVDGEVAVLGIEELTALVQRGEGDGWTVQGAGAVWVLEAAGRRRLGRGERLEIPA